MNKFSKRIALLSLSLVWVVGVWYGTRTVSVGMAFQPGQTGQISVVVVDAHGHEMESPRQVPDSNGVVTFGIARHAKSFYFRLYNGEAGRSRVWRLVDLRLCGVPAIPAAMVPRFEMRKKLYAEPPTRDDEPLVMSVVDGDPFNLPNVFPYLLHVLVTVQLVVAVLPILLVLGLIGIAIFWRRCGAYVCSFVNRESVFCWIVATVVILALPAPVKAVSSGLDPSWEWLLNLFAGEPVFGRDLVFTYGPLGFLISPQLSGANVAAGMAVNILFSALFGYLVVLIHRSRQSDSGSLASFLLLALWLLTWPNGMEWKWCLTSVTACALPVLLQGLDRRVCLLLAALAALTAVLQSFVKFSSCVAVVGQHVFLLIFGACRERRRMVPFAGVYLLAAFVSGALAEGFFFRSWSSFAAWIHGSLEIASGYNLVMGGDKPWPEIACVFGLVLSFFAFLLVGKNGRRASALYWIVFAPFLFCVYKYAVVRQSGMPFALGIAWLAALSMVAVPERGGRSVKMVAYFAGAAALLGIVWANMVPRVSLSPQNLLANLCPVRAMHWADEESRASIAAARLPSAWLDRIGSNRVMIAGWEMGPAMSGDLNLVPFPATQTYSAYTPYLDGCCAERVNRETDPVRFILAPANPWSFDSRNIYFDNPRLWREVRRHFQFVARNSGHVLLEKRSQPHPCEMQDRVFELERPILDKLRALFFRPKRAMAYFTFSDGRKYACFANLEVLNGTSVPRRLPTTPEDVCHYFGAKSDAISQLKEIVVKLGDETLFRTAFTPTPGPLKCGIIEP